MFICANSLGVAELQSRRPKGVLGADADVASQFAKDIQSSFKLDPIGYNSVNAETFLLPCVSGELLLFPSNLKHSVPINQSEETRYSMSFNTFGIDIGSEETLTHLDIRSMMHENN